MNTDWRRVLVRHLLLLVCAALLLGWLSGAYGWSMAACLAGYLAWLLRDMARLRRWLAQADPHSAVPDAHGLWEDLFGRVHHLQQRNRAARERLQAILDRAQESTAALKDAVVTLDSHGNLEWWNPAAQRLLGLRLPQDQGLPIANLVRHPRFKAYLAQAQHAEPLEIPSPLDERIQLQFTITRYGNHEHLMLVRDVTRMHQLEQMRKDFVANVSHELRTPLTVIAGYLETLLDNGDGILPRWKRALQQMQEQAGRMQQLLDDLLLLARLEATDYPSDNQSVAVARLLEAVRNDAVALSAGRHRIELDAAPAVGLRGSGGELRSAFSNLVFNAVKYTPAGGEIHIRWWADADGAHLAVTDSGPGIEAHHLSRLTERFYRVDASRASSTGGTGLGLAIVKHVLMRHHGRLTITSTPGVGSTFACHFPASQLAPIASPCGALQPR